MDRSGNTFKKPQSILSLSTLHVASSGHPYLSPLLPCPLPVLQGVWLGTEAHLVVVLNKKGPFLQRPLPTLRKRPAPLHSWSSRLGPAVLMITRPLTRVWSLHRDERDKPEHNSDDRASFYLPGAWVEESLLMPVCISEINILLRWCQSFTV